MGSVKEITLCASLASVAGLALAELSRFDCVIRISDFACCGLPAMCTDSSEFTHEIFFNISELRWIVCRANVSSAHRGNSPAGDVSLRVLRSTRVLI